jgi:hypothetical protein
MKSLFAPFAYFVVFASQAIHSRLSNYKGARISPPRSTPIRCVERKITMPPPFSKPEPIFVGFRTVGRLEEMG